MIFFGFRADLGISARYAIIVEWAKQWTGSIGSTFGTSIIRTRSNLRKMCWRRRNPRNCFHFVQLRTWYSNVDIAINQWAMSIIANAASAFSNGGGAPLFIGLMCPSKLHRKHGFTHIWCVSHVTFCRHFRIEGARLRLRWAPNWVSGFWTLTFMRRTKKKGDVQCKWSFRYKFWIPDKLEKLLLGSNYRTKIVWDHPEVGSRALPFISVNSTPFHLARIQVTSGFGFAIWGLSIINWGLCLAGRRLILHCDFFAPVFLFRWAPKIRNRFVSCLVGTNGHTLRFTLHGLWSVQITFIL